MNTIYHGYTRSISKQEADKNMEATLRAMVAEYPDNEYWKNSLADFLSEIEVRHDNSWLNGDWMPEAEAQAAEDEDARRTMHEAAM